MNYYRFGDKNPRWKGGVRKRKDGYILCYRPDHPYANKRFVLQHRVVMEAHVGRFLKPKEIVHHKNHNKSDNRLCNLELTTLSEHSSHHNKGVSNTAIRRFTLIEAEEIRKDYKNNLVLVNELAKKYGCARTVIIDCIRQQGAYGANNRLKRAKPIGLRGDRWRKIRDRVSPGWRLRMSLQKR